MNKIKYIESIREQIGVSGYTFEQKVEAMTQHVRYKNGLSSTETYQTYHCPDRSKAHKVIKSFLIGQGYQYIDNRRNNSIHATHVHSSGEYPNVTVEFTFHLNNFNFTAYGEDDYLDRIIAFCDDMFSKTETLIKTASSIDKPSDSIMYTTDRPHLSATRKPRDVFYPWLTIDHGYASLEAFYDAYLEADEDALVLIGESGTGKSTFLRGLIHHAGDMSTVAHSRAVIEHQKLIPDFMQSESRILGLEDVDNYLGAREDGNDFMSELLNQTEGVVEHSNKKIVVSTNLTSTNKIDSALMRDGRCFAVVKFRALTWEEANAVLVEMDRNPVYTVNDGATPLSTVLKHYKLGSSVRKQTKLGF